MTRVRSHLSFANVVSLMALFVALAGSAYAAFSLPANSVGTKQLRNRSVTLRKIAPSARRALRGNRGPQGVEGPQGIRGPQGARGPAGGPRGPQGFRGPQGVRGLQGLQGPKGTAGATGAPGPTTVTGYQIVTSSVTGQAAGTQLNLTATCPDTKKAVGGGVFGSGIQHSVNSSFPLGSGNAWKVTMNNNSTAPANFAVYAVCVNVTP